MNMHPHKSCKDTKNLDFTLKTCIFALCYEAGDQGDNGCPLGFCKGDYPHYFH